MLNWFGAEEEPAAQPAAPETTCPRCGAFSGVSLGNARSALEWWRCLECLHVWGDRIAVALDTNVVPARARRPNTTWMALFNPRRRHWISAAAAAVRA